MKKPDLHIVSFSGGKDSTAMLLHMMELGMQIDIVLYCDTWMEFPAMYRHVERVKKIVEDAGIKFVTLKSPESFKYMMLEHTVKRKKPLPGNPKGYSWAGSRSRWCTSKLKTDMLSKYKNALMEQYNIIEYVGIAADEQYRLERESKTSSMNIPLLIGVGMKQKHCPSAMTRVLIGKVFMNIFPGCPVGAALCSPWKNCEN